MKDEEGEEKFQINKVFDEKEKLKKKSDKYYGKLIVLFSIFNAVLTYLNYQKYIVEPRNNPFTGGLSQFRVNERMNVALAARSYDEQSDYFAAKSNLDNGYLIIKDGEIVPPKKDFPKTLDYIKHIRIGYTDLNESRAMFYINYLKTNFKGQYEFELVTEKVDYLIFGLEGMEHNNMKYNKAIKIGVYEEGFMPTFNEEDYILGVAHIFFLDRYFRKATLLEYIGELKNRDFRKIRKEVLRNKKREKFCGAVFGHERNEDNFRRKFVAELSKYKKVDMGGEIDNNVGYLVNNTVQFLSNYKFSIAMEKNCGDGYATGHIINSFLAGTIPIYYGDYLIDEYINKDAFILIRNEIDLKDKIEYIKKIDKDDKLYREFLRQDILVDDYIVEKRRQEEKDYWGHIFRPDKIDARRIENIRYRTRRCEEQALQKKKEEEEKMKKNSTKNHKK